MPRTGSRGLSTALCLASTVVLVASLAAERAAGQQAPGAEPSWEEKPYIQKDGAFDYGVYNGYRRYHATCHVCHGPDALGGSFAPALADSLKTMSYTDFLEVVVNGRERTVAGQQSVMPAFGNTEDVMLYIDHIYAYLKARADGALGRGRPERLPPEEDPVWQEYQAQRG